MDLTASFCGFRDETNPNDYNGHLQAHYMILTYVCSFITFLVLICRTKFYTFFGVIVGLGALWPCLSIVVSIHLPNSCQDAIHRGFWDDKMFLFMLNVLAILMIIAEVTRRNFVTLVGQVWFIVVVCLCVHFAVMSVDILWGRDFRIFMMFWNYINFLLLPVLNVIIGLIVLKLLHKQRQSASDSELIPLNGYRDINRDEKNFIFLFLIYYIVLMVFIQVSSAVFVAINATMGDGYETAINQVYNIIVILSSIIYISYAVECVNLNYFF